jgi:CHASE3 domain sensor protein
MSEKEDCRYTNMLNRLKVLDEQICKMQDTLKVVRELMRKDFEEKIVKEDKGETSPDQIRMASLEIMSEDRAKEDK